MPAVVFVLVVCMTGVQLALTQTRLVSAAATAARVVARGESATTAQTRISRELTGATVRFTRDDGMLCAHVSRTPTGPVETLLGATLVATSCALDDGA
jgi:hypothetical protein